MTVRYPLVLNGTSIQELQSGDSLNGLTSSTSLQKGNGTGGLTAATSGTDFAPATPAGQNPLASNGSGGFNAITVASPLSWNSATNTIGYSGGTGSGSVSSVALSMPSGFTVSGSPVTTTGTLSVSTSLSGLLKGNGSGFTTATSGDITATLGYTPPSATGSGASGTWGINVTGSAGSATSAYYSSTQGYTDNSTAIATTAMVQSTFANYLAGSLSANGYQKHPNGMILQWGAGTASSSGVANNFPTSFPNYCRSVVFVMANIAGVSPQGASVSASNFTATSSSASSQSIFYIAIGY